MSHLQPDLVKEISGQELVFFGVHGDDPTDQLLAAKVMDKLSDRLRNKAAIGLEQVGRRCHSKRRRTSILSRTANQVSASQPGSVVLR